MEEAMKLQDFVSETLNQIVNGVKQSQSQANEAGAVINPSYIHLHETKKYITHENKLVQSIDFDVAVTISEGKETKGGFGVFVAAIGAGTQGKSDVSSVSVSRVKFSVPLVFPEQENPDSANV